MQRVVISRKQAETAAKRIREREREIAHLNRYVSFLEDHITNISSLKFEPGKQPPGIMRNVKDGIRKLRWWKTVREKKTYEKLPHLQLPYR